MEPSAKRAKVADEPGLLDRLIADGQGPKIVATCIFPFLDALEYFSIRRTSKGVLAAVEGSVSLAREQWLRVFRRRSVSRPPASSFDARGIYLSVDVASSSTGTKASTQIGRSCWFPQSVDETACSDVRVPLRSGEFQIDTATAYERAHPTAYFHYSRTDERGPVELAVQVQRLVAKVTEKKDTPYAACLFAFRPWRCASCRKVTIERGSNDIPDIHDVGHGTASRSRAYRELLGGPICGVCEPDLLIESVNYFQLSRWFGTFESYRCSAFVHVLREYISQGKIKAAQLGHGVVWCFVKDMERIAAAN